MKIKDGRITILINEEKTRIEIRDHDASITFVRIELNPMQLSQALSRLSFIKCDMEVVGIDRIGKKMEHKNFEFKLRDSDCFESNNKEVAAKKVFLACPEGWIPDAYFNSQNSIFWKDKETWARTTIRRWV